MKKTISVLLTLMIIVSSFAGIGAFAETTADGESQKCNIYFYGYDGSPELLAEVDYGESFSKTLKGQDGWFLVSCIMSDGTVIKPEITENEEQVIDIPKVTGDVYIHRYTDGKINGYASGRGTALIVRNLQHVTTNAKNVDENGNSLVRYSENYYGYGETFTPEEGYEITGIRAYRSYSYIENDYNGYDFTKRKGYYSGELDLYKKSDGSYYLNTFPYGGYYFEIIAEPIDSAAENCSVNVYSNGNSYLSNSAIKVKKGSSYQTTVTSKYGEETGNMQVACFMSDGTAVKPEIINNYTQQITIPEVTGDIYFSVYTNKGLQNDKIDDSGRVLIKRNLQNVTTNAKELDDNNCTKLYNNNIKYSETFTPEDGYEITKVRVYNSNSKSIYNGIIDGEPQYDEGYVYKEYSAEDEYVTEGIYRRPDGSYEFTVTASGAYYIEVVATPIEDSKKCKVIAYTTGELEIENKNTVAKLGDSYQTTILGQSGAMYVSCFMSDGTVIKPEIIAPHLQQITIPEVTGDIYISAYTDANRDRYVVGGRGTAVIKRNLQNVSTDSQETDENNCTHIGCGTYLYEETFTPDEGYEIKGIKVIGTMSTCVYDINSAEYFESYNQYEISAGDVHGTDTIIKNDDGSYTLKSVPVNSYYIEVVAEPIVTNTTTEIPITVTTETTVTDNTTTSTTATEPTVTTVTEQPVLTSTEPTVTTPSAPEINSTKGTVPLSDDECQVEILNKTGVILSNNAEVVRKGDSYTTDITSNYGDKTAFLIVSCLMSDGTVIKPEITDKFTQRVTIPKVTGKIYLSVFSELQSNMPVVGGKGYGNIVRKLKNVSCDYQNSVYNQGREFIGNGTFLYTETYRPEPGYEITGYTVKNTKSVIYNEFYNNGMTKPNYGINYYESEFSDKNPPSGIEKMEKNEDGSYTLTIMPSGSYYVEVTAVPKKVEPTTTKPVVKKVTPVLSTKSITVYPKNICTVKVNNANSTVKWTTTNGKICSVLSTKGKYNQIATILVKQNTGVAYVKATMNSKTAKCKVNVKSDKSVSRLKVTKVSKTKKSFTVKACLENKGKKAIKYGYGYHFEKLVNGQWTKVKVNKNRAFASGLMNLKAKGRLDFTFKFGTNKKKDYYLVSVFTKGTYRLCIDAKLNQSCKSAIFTIK